MNLKTLLDILGVSFAVFVFFILPRLYRAHERRQLKKAGGIWVAPPDPARGADNFRETVLAAINDTSRQIAIARVILLAVTQSAVPESASPFASDARVKVIVVNGGPRAIDVVECLRLYIRPDLGLADAKRVYDYAPQTVKEALTPADAAMVKAMLEAVGATARIE